MRDVSRRRGDVASVLSANGSPAGFSLLEALISLTVFSLILIGLHNLTLTSERSQEVGSRITRANQDLRAALEIVSRDLRMAGSGFAGLPVQTADGPMRRVIYPVTPGCTYGSESDSVQVLASLDGTATVLVEPMTTPSSEMKCASLEGFSPGDLVVVTDGVFADMFEVTAVVVQGGGPGGKLSHNPSRPKNDASGHSEWPAGGYATGSRVTKVNTVVLRTVQQGDELRLYRKVDDGPAVPLVSGVRKLTFTYRLGDGTETRNPPVDADIMEIMVGVEAGLRSGWGAGERVVAMATSVRPRST